MAQNHEETIAELHATMEQRTDQKHTTDIAGGSLPVAEKGDIRDVELQPTAEGDEPNEQEKSTLRHIGENLPTSAYLIAVVELCERFTCKILAMDQIAYGYG